MTNSYHTPVLLNESIDGLDIKAGGVYVDVTFGGGGHSREILRRMDAAEKKTGGHEARPYSGRLYSFDQDPDAEKNGAEMNDERWTFVRSNFRYLKNWMMYFGEFDNRESTTDNRDSEIENRESDIEPGIDGILADLGVSSHHLDAEDRGFSFRFEAPIDMRMNKRAGKTAADILNEYTEEHLADIFYLYGEVKQARKLAALIVKQRTNAPYKTTGDLAKTCEQCLPRERAKKEMAKVFQALRIEVNHEMDALKEMLKAATEVLKPGGRLSVITYHSLEDRIVKNFMKTGNAEGKMEQDFFGRISSPLKTINNKPILPSAEEQERNPRSRSAKLRVAIKVGADHRVCPRNN